MVKKSKTNLSGPVSVDLYAESLGTRSFSYAHAERLLTLQASGWSLPENSEYIFDKERK